MCIFTGQIRKIGDIRTNMEKLFFSLPNAGFGYPSVFCGWQHLTLVNRVVSMPLMGTIQMHYEHEDELGECRERYTPLCTFRGQVRSQYMQEGDPRQQRMWISYSFTNHCVYWLNDTKTLNYKTLK